ncbi:hypothetical protein RUMHYD_02060 [Blautia hydrogenotrophica DSM 10507]|uniref:Uncharacterized protein n=1 Tax=Blautia hydrogenotrophica (strain DSM 10507 / JCM 14656 / S5a33) TaxID=476272 RepID=C0CMH7_BLAHS|nr:hypothetical protein RUMHYD_02060 [Blautia hydrogenotrophica DSM 10507]
MRRTQTAVNSSLARICLGIFVQNVQNTLRDIGDLDCNEMLQ